MKPLFSKRPSLQMRLFCALIAAITLIVMDHRLIPFTVVRHYLDTAATPLYYIANAPWRLLDTLSEQLTTRQQLQLENRALRQELLFKKSELLLFEQLRQENTHFRQLLNVSIRPPQRKIIARIISAHANGCGHPMIIDKGELQGVYSGQPVISDKGVVGQVVATSRSSSRVLPICDANHAISVRVARNDIQAIVRGTSELAALRLEPLPSSIDIKIGDHLVTSGLDGHFPEGYSVATVTSVTVDRQRAHTVVTARTTVALERLRYLLLLWSDQLTAHAPPSSGKITAHGTSHER